MSTKVHQWSPQQQAVIDFVLNDRRSANIIAVAGAGKTSTILGAIAKLPANASAIYVVFNKDVATETTEKLKAADVHWKKCRAATVHSVGFKAFREHLGDPKTITEHKVRDIFDAMIEASTIPMIMAPFRALIVKMVGFAKDRALGVVRCGAIDSHDAWLDIIHHFDLLNDIDDEFVPEAGKRLREIVDTSIAVLKKSNSVLDVIDYGDMIYLPLLHQVRFWRYNYVFLDEAQDTNPARRALIRAITNRGGRVFAVGDPRQAIYGFTGADNNAMDLIKQDFNSVELPLTVTYRCPKAVVSFSQQWVSHIQAHETAPEGLVSSCTWDQMLERPNINGESAILCRNTKPLVMACFKLIRLRVPCKIEGKDIGSGLKRLATRWARVKTLETLSEKLDVHIEKMRTKYLASKQEEKAQHLEDQVETLQVIIDQCRTEKKTHVTDAVEYIDSLFADDVHKSPGVLVLSTIHKAKGREWNTVFWLDRHNTCPSRYARQAWQQEQEENLQYVAATRAKNELIDLSP
jgi:DNA helicase-2/ATP-dependent DNA helicase PcrA